MCIRDRFALGTLQKAETVRVLPEGGARYVVPQRLVKGEGKAALYFRVSAAFQPARLTVTSGDKEIKSVKKRIMTPGEMEKTVIDLGDVTGDVVVRVEEG